MTGGSRCVSQIDSTAKTWLGKRGLNQSVPNSLHALYHSNRTPWCSAKRDEGRCEGAGEQLTNDSRVTHLDHRDYTPISPMRVKSELYHPLGGHSAIRGEKVWCLFGHTKGEACSVLCVGLWKAPRKGFCASTSLAIHCVEGLPTPTSEQRSSLNGNQGSWTNSDDMSEKKKKGTKKNPAQRKEKRAARVVQLERQKAYIVKKQQNPKNKGALSLGKVIRGRGDYGLGDMGAQVGSWASGKLKSFFTSIFGSGDYNINPGAVADIRQNSLLASSTIPTFGTTNGGIRFQFHEFLGNLAMTVDPTVTSWVIDPTKRRTFPWGGRFSDNFQQWILHGGCFVLDSTSSEMAVGSNGLGSISGSIRYDVTSPAPTTEVEILNALFSSSDKPSRNQMFPIECDPKLTIISPMKILPPGSTRQDLQFYQMGILDIMTSGSAEDYPGAVKVWITYDMEYLKPATRESSGGSMFFMDLLPLGGDPGTPLRPLPDTVLVKQPRVDTIGMFPQADQRNISFPLSIEVDSLWLVTWYVGGTATDNLTLVTMSGSGGMIETPVFFDQGWGEVNAPSTGGSNSGLTTMISQAYYKYDGSGTELSPPNILFTLSGGDGLLPSASIGGGITIQRQDTSISTGLSSRRVEKYTRTDFFQYLCDAVAGRVPRKPPPSGLGRVVDWIHQFSRTVDWPCATPLPRSSAPFDLTFAEALGALSKYVDPSISSLYEHKSRDGVSDSDLQSLKRDVEFLALRAEVERLKRTTRERSGAVDRKPRPPQDFNDDWGHIGYADEMDPEVQSDLNGNQGSCTNTDDVEQVEVEGHQVTCTYVVDRMEEVTNKLVKLQTELAELKRVREHPAFARMLAAEQLNLRNLRITWGLSGTHGSWTNTDDLFGDFELIVPSSVCEIMMNYNIPDAPEGVPNGREVWRDGLMVVRARHRLNIILNTMEEQIRDSSQYRRSKYMLSEVLRWCNFGTNYRGVYCRRVMKHFVFKENGAVVVDITSSRCESSLAGRLEMERDRNSSASVAGIIWHYLDQSFRCRSSLNGNQGSWTNSDDVAEYTKCHGGVKCDVSGGRHLHKKRSNNPKSNFAQAMRRLTEAKNAKRAKEEDRKDTPRGPMKFEECHLLYPECKEAEHGHDLGDRRYFTLEEKEDGEVTVYETQTQSVDSDVRCKGCFAMFPSKVVNYGLCFTCESNLVVEDVEQSHIPINPWDDHETPVVESKVRREEVEKTVEEKRREALKSDLPLEVKQAISIAPSKEEEPVVTKGKFVMSAAEKNYWELESRFINGPPRIQADQPLAPKTIDFPAKVPVELKSGDKRKFLRALKGVSAAFYNRREWLQRQIERVKPPFRTFDEIKTRCRKERKKRIYDYESEDSKSQEWAREWRKHRVGGYCDEHWCWQANPCEIHGVRPRGKHQIPLKYADSNAQLKRMKRAERDQGIEVELSGFPFNDPPKCEVEEFDTLHCWKFARSLDGKAYSDNPWWSPFVDLDPEFEGLNVYYLDDEIPVVDIFHKARNRLNREEVVITDPMDSPEDYGEESLEPVEAWWARVHPVYGSPSVIPVAPHLFDGPSEVRTVTVYYTMDPRATLSLYSRCCTYIKDRMPFLQQGVGYELNSGGGLTQEETVFFRSNGVKTYTWGLPWSAHWTKPASYTSTIQNDFVFLGMAYYKSCAKVDIYSKLYEYLNDMSESRVKDLAQRQFVRRTDKGACEIVASSVAAVKSVALKSPIASEVWNISPEIFCNTIHHYVQQAIARGLKDISTTSPVTGLTFGAWGSR